MSAPAEGSPSLSRKRTKDDMEAHARRRVNGGKTQLPQAMLSRIPDKKNSRNASKWTPEEDEALVAAVRKHGEVWTRVSAEVPNRNNVQCSQRWNKSLRPGLVRGKWSPEEDAKLMSALTTLGHGAEVDWNQVALKVEGRNPKQCKERFRLKLDPELKREEWTAEEDALLLASFDKHNGRWAAIAKDVPGRREDAVKIRFRSLQRQASRVRQWSLDEDVALIASALASRETGGNSEADKENPLIAKRSKRTKALRFQELCGKYPIFKSAYDRKATLSVHEIKRLMSIDQRPHARAASSVPQALSSAAAAAATTTTTTTTQTAAMPLMRNPSAMRAPTYVTRALSSRILPPVPTESPLPFGFHSFTAGLPAHRMSSLSLGSFSDMVMPPPGMSDTPSAAAQSGAPTLGSSSGFGSAIGGGGGGGGGHDFGAALAQSLVKGKKMRRAADSLAARGDTELDAGGSAAALTLAKTLQEMLPSGPSESSAPLKTLRTFESSLVRSMSADSMFDFTKN